MTAPHIHVASLKLKTIAHMCLVVGVVRTKMLDARIYGLVRGLFPLAQFKMYRHNSNVIRSLTTTTILIFLAGLRTRL
jgi:hypothetical protein